MLRSAARCCAFGAYASRAVHRRDMQGLEKAHAKAQLRRTLQPKLLWLGEWLSDPQHSPLPPCGYARARMRACVRVRARIL